MMHTSDYNELKNRCRRVGRNRYQFRNEGYDWSPDDMRLMLNDAKKHAKNMWMLRPLASGITCTAEHVDLFFDILKNEEIFTNA